MEKKIPKVVFLDMSQGSLAALKQKNIFMEIVHDDFRGHLKKQVIVVRNDCFDRLDEIFHGSFPFWKGGSFLFFESARAEKL